MNVPIIRLEDVHQEARTFLRKYHPQDTLPIPIEDIVELQMNIGLSVVNGIKQLLDIDAFINQRFTEIVVDAFSFEKYPARTRFSIAHEIGHFILHREWYEHNGPENIDNYLEFLDKMNDETYKRIERQANTFAGLVLIPTEHLTRLIKQRVGRLPNNEEPELLAGVIQDLPTIFNVSEMPLLWRLQDEKIIRRVAFY
ncbi:MAG: ImmA/IrrE family metallo-endopeptidase [bacterium]|nr:ImmA/IrrE family metallo-endopeptidase [bacterium]